MKKKRMSNRWLYSLITLGIILAIVGVVYAVTGVSHSVSELVVDGDIDFGTHSIITTGYDGGGYLIFRHSDLSQIGVIHADTDAMYLGTSSSSSQLTLDDGGGVIVNNGLSVGGSESITGSLSVGGSETIAGNINVAGSIDIGAPSESPGLLNVDGSISAISYCDEDGQNCESTSSLVTHTDLTNYNYVRNVEIVSYVGSSISSVATCPSGKKIIGGGCGSLYSASVSASYPVVASQSWQCYFESASSGSNTAYAICANY